MARDSSEIGVTGRTGIVGESGVTWRTDTTFGSGVTGRRGIALGSGVSGRTGMAGWLRVGVSGRYSSSSSFANRSTDQTGSLSCSDSHRFFEGLVHRAARGMVNLGLAGTGGACFKLTIGELGVLFTGVGWICTSLRDATLGVVGTLFTVGTWLTLETWIGRSANLSAVP